jgi:hypothetical protein
MGGIFLIQNDGQLVEMTEEGYVSEDLLQEYLAKYPNLLAGDQMDSASPRRWLLISREMSLASEEEGPGRWSVDHLFLDQDAVPTIVEVKRSSDTRIRREVVGQMLDYAANAVVYWPVETLRARFEAHCENQGLDPDETVADHLGLEVTSDELWQKVKTNLQAGKVRMLFVADEIPSELRRVVEFLNAQMDPAEVLAVEIRQYVGQGQKTLIPRVLGQTVEAQKKKSNTPRDSNQWNETSFIQDLENRRGKEEAVIAQRILDWARQNSLRIWWGKGAKDGSFYLLLDRNQEFYYIAISVWTYGRVEVQFQYMRGKAPFDDEAKRIELLQRLNAISGIFIPSDGIGRRPTFPLASLKENTSFSQFLNILNWVVEEIKAV